MIHAIIYTLQEKKLNETFRFIFCWEESLALYQAQSFLVGLYSCDKNRCLQETLKQLTQVGYLSAYQRENSV